MRPSLSRFSVWRSLRAECLDTRIFVANKHGYTGRSFFRAYYAASETSELKSVLGIPHHLNYRARKKKKKRRKEIKSARCAGCTLLCQHRSLDDGQGNLKHKRNPILPHNTLQTISIGNTLGCFIFLFSHLFFFLFLVNFSPAARKIVVLSRL